MTFWHIGILTPDISKTLDTLCAMPATHRDDWSIMEIDFPPSEMRTGNGGKLKAAMGRVGGIVYELLEPLDALSYHASALIKRGPGFHHTAYICGDSLDAAVASCIDAGARIVWEARHGGEHVYYLESADGGSVFELINNCPFIPAED